MVYTLSEGAEQHYLGAGYALGVVNSSTGEVCNFRYTADIAEDAGVSSGEDLETRDDVLRVMKTTEFARVSAHLSLQGHLIVGMLSGRTFTEL